MTVVSPLQGVLVFREAHGTVPWSNAGRHLCFLIQDGAIESEITPSFGENPARVRIKAASRFPLLKHFQNLAQLLPKGFLGATQEAPGNPGASQEENGGERPRLPLPCV